MRHILLYVVTVLVLASTALAATINVPADQPTIQAGIDAATQGDTVLIADGTYTGDGNRDINFGGKEIVVRSASGADAVTIDCEADWHTERHRGFIFDSGETALTVLDGVTVTDAAADTGACVLVRGTSPTVKGCRFVNSGYGDAYSGHEMAGGGVACLDNAGASFTSCYFGSNQAQSGGGIYVENSSNVTVDSCLFEANWTGGWLLVNDGIRNGGAACLYQSDVSFTACRFIRNWGDSHLGGLGSAGAVSYESSPSFSFCEFARDSLWGDYASSGLALWFAEGAPVIENCTFFANKGHRWVSVVYGVHAFMTIRNCLFVGNNLEDPVIRWDSPTTIECTNIYGNSGGDWVGDLAPFFQQDGNFSADPLFCDPENGDFTLGDVSPCLPANNECGVQIGAYGQGCTGCFDIDEDSHCYVDDNCPDVYNPGQEDADGVGLGDACCCVCPTVGNIDGSADCLVTMADLTSIISHLFILIEPYDCPPSANVDGSPDGLVTMGDLTVLIDHLFISLQPLGPCNPVGASSSALLTGHSACKGEDQQAGAAASFSLESCIDWSYSGSTLNFTHRDAGFNCCPVILADITVDNNVITVTEIDSLFEGGCWCECLYDVDYQITGLAAGEYQIVIESPYRPAGDEVLDVTIDLITEPTGSHCVPRSQYPWSDL